MTRELDFDQAVVLSGGGAYGAYEVGVMKALFTGESPSTQYDYINPGIFTGTSVGAFNAAFLVSRSGENICDAIRSLESVWLSKLAQSSQTCGNGIFRFRANPLTFLNPNCLSPNPVHPFYELAGDGAFFAQDWFERAANFLMTSGSLPNRVLELFDISSFISNAPMSNLFRATIELEDIRSSDRKLRIVATNWDEGTVKVFENRDMIDESGYEIIKASASIPGIFRPQSIAGQQYVDGGVLMNTPLKCAIAAGATTLHVIYMDPDPKNISIQALESAINALDRVLQITSATKVEEDIETAAWINDGLAVIERVAQGEILADSEMQAFIRVANQIYQRLERGSPYKKLTIHRYHPHDDLGGGTLGLLNLDQTRMFALIERGFDDALNHNCARSHCVLPN
jgi:NTE family protein